jgi:hypothetical protein
MSPPATKDATPLKESPFAAESITAKDLIVGFQQLIDGAHQHGIRVFGGTLTPCEGADYFTQDGENRLVRK